MQSEINLYVNRLNSDKTVIPYDYNYFDFCSSDEIFSPVENIGQIIFGERIQSGPYSFDFLENVDCAMVNINQIF